MDENKKVWITVAAILAVIVLAVAIYYFLIRNRAEKEPAVSEVTEAVSTEPPEVEETGGKGEVVVPYDVKLDDSDPLVRDAVKSISSSSRLKDWLASPDLIRKFVAAIDNIANGQSPRAHFDFFRLQDAFKVEQKSGRDYIDPSSYSRYNAIADAFVSLDTDNAVGLFRKLKPVIQDAYHELGYPDREFQDTLEKAIRELFGVPVSKDILLQKKVVSYAMTDPHLEGLSQAQKHLLRMGPENVKKIQSKLRDIALALGVPATSLPSK
ncbi:MAG: DUF3014 domain-containing protein [Candidatus Aminicenantes bacterium]|nr:DUF3014 domain-containing protein [Candidatus Aminicenantes bacterium]